MDPVISFSRSFFCHKLLNEIQIGRERERDQIGSNHRTRSIPTEPVKKPRRQIGSSYSDCCGQRCMCVCQSFASFFATIILIMSSIIQATVQQLEPNSSFCLAIHLGKRSYLEQSGTVVSHDTLFCGG